MKKLIPFILCIMLLAGCAETPTAELERFSQSVYQAQKLQFSAKVRAEYAEKTSEFELLYSKEGERERVEVISPELLAGIAAEVSDDGLSLEYEGAMLDIGTLDEAGLSPMSALPLLARAMSDGHTEICWTEGESIAARIVPEDGYAVTLWLSRELVPLSAEISYDERSVVFIEITDWRAE